MRRSAATVVTQHAHSGTEIKNSFIHFLYNLSLLGNIIVEYVGNRR